MKDNYMKKIVNPIFAIILEFISIGGIFIIQYFLNTSTLQDPKYLFITTCLRGLVGVFPLISMFAITIQLIIVSSNIFTKRQRIISAVGLGIFGIFIIAYFIGFGYSIYYVIKKISNK